MEDYAAKMARKSLDELREYLAHHAGYREAAVVAAIDELRHRGEALAPEATALRASLQLEAERQHAADEARRAEEDAQQAAEPPVAPWGGTFSSAEDDDSPAGRPARRPTPAAAATTDADAPVLYSPAVIFLFSVLISAFVGGVLLVLNLLRVRQRTAAWLVAAFSVGYTLVAATLSRTMGP